MQKANGMTTRQQEVLALITEGMSNKQIGYKLGLSEKTIKAHVTGLLKSLGVASRTEAISKVLLAEGDRMPSIVKPHPFVPNPNGRACLECGQFHAASVHAQFTKPTPEQIIERVFRAVFPTAPIEVRWLASSEQWHVVVNNDEWVCQVGSDDDQFHFRHSIPGGPGPGYDEMLSFPFPTDWEF